MGKGIHRLSAKELENAKDGDPSDGGGHKEHAELLALRNKLLFHGDEHLPTWDRRPF